MHGGCGDRKTAGLLGRPMAWVLSDLRLRPRAGYKVVWRRQKGTGVAGLTPGTRDLTRGSAVVVELRVLG